jgi:hypothetical protein
MGLTALAERAGSQLYRLRRVAVAVPVLATGIWLGGATVASTPAGASQCDVTSVLATTHNKTSDSLKLGSASHGLTNDWCTYPGNPIGPQSVTQWEIGDNFFETDVNVAYVAPNNDTIALTAAARYGGGVEARCHVVPNGKVPSPYRCSAKVHKESVYRGGIGNTHIAKVEWVIERH